MLVRDNVYMLDSARRGLDYGDRKVSCNVYAISLTNGFTLIDSGFPSLAKEIYDELQGMQEGKPLSRILLTHSDLDHVGNAQELQKMTGCKVYISQGELVYVNSVKERFGMKQKMFEDSGIKMPELTAYQGMQLDEFRIIPTPGHTEGHVSLLYEDILFPGDICSFIEGAFRGPNPTYTEDMDRAWLELRNLGKYEFSLVCPAHGAPFERGSYFNL